MSDSNVCTDCDPDIYLYVNTGNLEFYKCSRCSANLCNTHFIRATENGKYYGYGDQYAMCDQCCWFEIG